MVWVWLTFDLAVIAAWIAYLVSIGRWGGGGRRWRLAGTALAGLFLAVSVPFVRSAGRRQEARSRYDAALDLVERGDLRAAEAELRRSLSLDPGLPGGQEKLRQLTQPQTPAPRGQQVRLRAPVVTPATPPKGTSPGTRDPPRHPPHRPSPFVITRYDLDLHLDPAGHAFQAVATVGIRRRLLPEPSRDDLSVLEFALAPEFKVLRVVQDARLLATRHVNDLLTVKPVVRPTVDRDTFLRFTYRRPDRGPRVHGGDQIAPEGCFLRAEGRWYPATGELDFRAPVAVSVTVPRGFSAVAPGRLTSVEKPRGKVRFRWQSDRPAAMIAVAAARYQQVRGPGPVPLVAYVFPRHLRRARPFLREAARIRRFYETRFGPYPFEKLAIVEIPRFPGGYGTTSFLMLTEASFDAPSVPTSFLAHEIAHQWWGNSVFPQGPGAGWLSEAFAEYASYWYVEQVYGRAGLTRMLRRAAEEYRAAVSRKPEEPIRETDPYDQRGAYREVIYFKGASVLHALRATVGDPAFGRIMRRFADDYRHGKASIPDFQRVAAAEAGQPLNWFFDQWLGRSGAPRFTYRTRTDQGPDGRPRAIVELRQEGRPYRAPLVLVIDAQNQIQRHRVWVSRAEESWSFPIPGPLSLVGLDPNEDLLKMPPRWEAADAPLSPRPATP